MNLAARTIPSLALALLLTACATPATPTPSPSSNEPEVEPTSGTTPTPATTPGPTAAPRPTSDAATPEGWARISVPERGFSLAVPPEWEELSPATISDSEVMDRMLEANPDATVVVEQAQAALANGQIAVFAFDASADGIRSGFATNLNAIDVGPVEGTAEQTADEMADAVRQQIPILGGVESDTVGLPAGDAARLRYDWRIDSGDGRRTTVQVTQYAILAGSGSGYILSLSTTADDAGRYEDTFRQIAESFREEPD